MIPTLTFTTHILTEKGSATLCGLVGPESTAMQPNGVIVATAQTCPRCVELAQWHAARGTTWNAVTVCLDEHRRQPEATK